MRALVDERIRFLRSFCTCGVPFMGERAPSIVQVDLMRTATVERPLIQHRENGLHDEAAVKSMLRVKSVLKMLPESECVDLDTYGSGTTRSLEEYEAFAGVCFRKGEILERAKCGGLDRSQFYEERVNDALSLVMAMMNKT